MRITNVKAYYCRCPVHIPLKDAAVYPSVVVVRIDTDEGIVGHGVSGGILPQAVQEFVNSQAGTYIKGADPLNTERIWDDLYRAFNIRSLSGVWSSGVSAIDIALWDIKGKYYGESITRLLGGARDKVPAYITFGFLEYSKEELVAVAKMLVAQGHDKLKIVVGIDQGNHVEEDAARVRAVREAVGDRVKLMVDANCIYSFTQARELCRLIEPYGIAWFEEPLCGNDFRLLANLRQHTSIPIAAGQNLGHSWHHRELIVNHAVDISQPNVCFVGGYSEGVKVASLARAFNLPIATGGGWPHHNMHLQAGLSNGTEVEFHMYMWQLADLLFEGAPQPEGGWVSIPQRPGLGFELCMDAVIEHSVAIED